MPGLDKRLIDTTADPCTDFFKYACGNFSKLYPIPNDRSAYGTGAMVADYTEYVLHTMLEKAAAGGAGRTPNEQKIGDSYAACMDVDAINQKGLKPLQPELDRIAALKSKDELPELLARFQLIGVNAFHELRRTAGLQGCPQADRSGRSGWPGPAGTRLLFPHRRRSREDPHPVRAAHRQHAEADGRAGRQGGQRCQAIMQLETALAKVSMDITSRRDPNKVYHLMPVSELATLAPGLAWDRFLAASGAPPVTELNVTNPDFFKGLNALLASTDLDTIKTYLRWQLILSDSGLRAAQGARR